MDFLTQLRRYFAAEKNESLLFMLIGATTLMTACFCFFWWGKPFYLGMAWPLLAIAIVEIVVGGSVFFRTDGQLKALEEQFERSPADLAAAELPRMKAVMRNFQVYRWVEITFMVVGLGLILWNVQPDFWKGWGAGMFLQGGLMLLADFFAEKRGQEYVNALNEISNESP